MKWAEISAVTTDDAAELVGNIFIEEGCGGVAITGPSVVASEWSEMPADAPPPEHTTVTGYLPVEDSLEGRLVNIRERFRAIPDVGIDIGPGELTVKPVEDSDWAGAWKSFFKAVEIGNVFIKPSWEDVEVKPGQIVVEIDPGMAFGTGNHPTTQMCVMALQKHVLGGERMLDVGTGSGILSIAAIKLGVAEIIATEIDSVAVEAARDNMTRNGVDGRVQVFHTDTPENVSGVVDFAVANITADPIIGLAPALAKAVMPDGKLLISGIITTRAEEVISKLAEHGFDEIERNIDDDWVAVVLHKY